MALVSRELTTKHLTTPTHHVPKFARGRSRAYQAGLKRVLDLLVIFLSMPLWMPVIAVGAILAMSDGGSAFYRQDRVGKNGRVFRLWKLRTMVVDADANLEAYLNAHPEARAEWDRDQKLKHDPRITRFGRILRKTSLDELPQLLNVLIGDMSLVGPRPIMISQKSLYHGESYFEMRPGLTGLWQVADRNQSRFSDRVRYDDIYANSVSLWTDISILARTVGVVLRGTGY